MYGLLNDAISFGNLITENEAFASVTRISKQFVILNNNSYRIF